MCKMFATVHISFAQLAEKVLFTTGRQARAVSIQQLHASHRIHWTLRPDSWLQYGIAHSLLLSELPSLLS